MSSLPAKPSDVGAMIGDDDSRKIIARLDACLCMLSLITEVMTLDWPEPQRSKALEAMEKMRQVYLQGTTQ
jgi:hypothetical protein